MSQKWASPKYLGYPAAEVNRKIDILVRRRDAAAALRNEVHVLRASEMTAEQRGRFGFDESWKPGQRKPTLKRGRR
jgi:hypothetical protein